MTDRSARPPISRFGDFEFAPGQRRLQRDGVAVNLSSRAMDILAALLERPGEVIGKQELLERVWGGAQVVENVLRVHMVALRRALGDGEGGARLIATVPGRGYCFTGELQSEGEAHGGSVQPVDIVRRLPARPTRVIGREGVIEDVRRLLERERFVTIVGPGGIGKTTVALMASHDRSAVQGGDVVFVDLGAIAPGSEQGVVDALCETLGGAAEDRTSLETVLDQFRDRRALVVFDTCEGVIDAAARLAGALLASAPGVHLLATSRESLRAEGEQIYRIGPLPTPPSGRDVTAQEALTYSAVQLFVERVAAVDAGFEFSDQHAAVVGAICRELDGIALAIELAAGRVEAFGVQQVAEQLATEFALTWPGRRTATPRQQTLRATLNWSHELLGSVERVVFRRLSVLVGAFSLETAVSVCFDEAELSSTARISEAISSLVAKSLVSTVIDGSSHRFRMLDTTRSYALAKLAESGDEWATRQRQAEHYIARLSAYGAEHDEPSAVAEETANVSAVLNWAFGGAGDPAIGVRCLGAAAGFWVLHGLLTECRRWAPVVQARLTSDPAPSDLGTRLILANALILTDGIDPDKRRETEAAYVSALKHGRQDERVSGLVALWVDQQRRGRYVAAERLIDEADFLVAANASPAHRLTAIWLRGATDHRAGRHARACEYLHRLLSEYTDASGRDFLQLAGYDLEVAGATILGLSELLRGNLKRGLAINERAIAKARTLSSPVSLKVVLRWRALMIYFINKDSAEVDRLTREILPSGAIDNVNGPDGAALATRGLWLAHGGDGVRGAEMVRRGLNACTRTEYTTMHSLVRAEVALQLLRHGAGEEIDEFLAPLEHGDEEDSWSTPEVLRIRGEIAERRGNSTLAETRYREAVALAEQQGALTWQLRAATSLATLWIGEGRSAEAGAILLPVYQQCGADMASGDTRRAAACLDACCSADSAHDPAT